MSDLSRHWKWWRRHFSTILELATGGGRVRHHDRVQLARGLYLSETNELHCLVVEGDQRLGCFDLAPCVIAGLL
jgi:hypothetical protein